MSIQEIEAQLKVVYQNLINHQVHLGAMMMEYAESSALRQVEKIIAQIEHDVDTLEMARTLSKAQAITA